MARRILGVDPGLQRTGWGVIDAEDSALRYVACGGIASGSAAPMPNRLLILHRQLTEVIERYRPGEAAIEETFVNKNALSSLKLGHARGALILTLSQAGLAPREYAATQVKKSVTGVGRAEKHQVAMMVSMLLPGADLTSADAADALAVAICHAHLG